MYIIYDLQFYLTTIGAISELVYSVAAEVEGPYAASVVLLLSAVQGPAAPTSFNAGMVLSPVCVSANSLVSHFSYVFVGKKVYKQDIFKNNY